MTRKCAVIGASSESIHAINVAQRFGYHVLALDGDPSALGLVAADSALVVDITDSDLVVQALKEEKILFVLPVPIGRWLETTGEVNDSLGLFGPSRDSIVRCVDKYEFHQRLSMAGLRTGACVLATSTDCLKEVQHYPAIIKPRFGSGSRGVFLAQSQRELVEYGADLDFSGNYIVEDVAEGVEYGLDAYVQSGELHIVLLREKCNTPPPARQCVGYYSVNRASNNDMYKRVADKIQPVVKALGLNNCLLHADLMIDGEVVFVIELSPRPSGHYLHNLFTPLCTNVDLIERFIEMANGKPAIHDYVDVKPMLIRFFDFSNVVVTHVPSDAEVAGAVGDALVAYSCSLGEGMQLSAVKDGHSLMARGFMILQAEDKAKLDAFAESVLKLFEVRKNEQ